jgi:transcriptional regulator with XRE-family HTH domain
MTITPETIRIIREVYRLTIQDMAALLNISTASMWRIEHGLKPINAEIIEALKMEFELTPEKLAWIYSTYEATGGSSNKRVRLLKTLSKP